MSSNQQEQRVGNEIPLLPGRRNPIYEYPRPAEVGQGFSSSVTIKGELRYFVGIINRVQTYRLRGGGKGLRLFFETDRNYVTVNIDTYFSAREKQRWQAATRYFKERLRDCFIPG